MTFDFILSRAGQTIGHITWFCGGDDGNGTLKGDHQAVSELQQAVKTGIRQAWRGAFPPPRRVIVQDPVNYISQMVTVIEQAGFDMPDILLPYTAAEQRKQRMQAEEPPPADGVVCY